MGSNLGGKMFDSDICKKKDGSTLKLMNLNMKLNKLLNM